MFNQSIFRDVFLLYISLAMPESNSPGFPVGINVTNLAPMCTYLTITLREAVCLTSTANRVPGTSIRTLNKQNKTPTANMLIAKCRPKASASLTPRSLYSRATHSWTSASSRQTAVPNTLARLALHVRAPSTFLCAWFPFVLCLAAKQWVDRLRRFIESQQASRHAASQPLSAHRPLDEFWQPNIGKV